MLERYVRSCGVPQKKKWSPEKGWLEPGIRAQVAALNRWPGKPHWGEIQEKSSRKKSYGEV